MAILLTNQEINANLFIGISVVHQVLFYTLSPVSDEDLDTILMPIIDLLSETFNLDANSKHDLIDCYNEPPSIKTNNGSKYIMKGDNVGISLVHLKSNTCINDENLYSYNIGLESLWNSIFKVLLSDTSEPILLMGPSGFKTFLSQILLPESSVITLNQESTIAQLLGSSGFFTSSEAKLFYLEYICKISEQYSEYPRLRAKWEKGELKKEDVTGLFGGRYTSFQYARDHLTEKLFEVDENQNNCVLSNITLEFRPGLFLSAILEKKSLILKDLSNLPTIVLERFNELFSGKHNLTLNEDIHNTFTPDYMKELTNFNSSFRVFATCPANSASRLSEAVLSRFSVVSLPDYKPEEQKIVLQSCIGINRFIFDTSSIPKLIHLSTACLERMHKQFTFTQMIKTIELSSLLNKEAEGDKQDRNLSIIAYRLFGGLLDSKKIRKQYREIVEEIISDSEDPSNSLNNNFKGYSEAPLSFTDIEGYQGIKSNISELFIKCPNAQLPNTNLAFISLYTEMVDILHLGLLIQSPVIFEGPPGQGKMTAIKYIASATGYEVVTIMISQSTKVDDLLGKVTISRDSKKEIHVEMIETKLVKALKSEGESNTIIVFQNINNASPAVLNILVSTRKSKRSFFQTARQY